MVTLLIYRYRSQIQLFNYIFVKNNTMITLTKEQLQQLENFLLELPAKYANPIFSFLGQLAKEQGVQEEATTEA